MTTKFPRSKPDLGTASVRVRGAISPPPTRKRRRSSPEENENALHNSIADNTRNFVTPLPANAIRVFSWNINGISPFVQPSISSFLNPTANAARSSPSLRGFLRRNHWPHIVNLQEVKINPSDDATKRAVEKAVNHRGDGPVYAVHFCLPRDKYNARGFGRKVYGVATIIRKDFLEDEVVAVREVQWDVEGRILVVETKSKLSIWNIYAVNGTDNPYKDPSTGQVVGTRHDRKLAFHKLLLQECRQLESQGWRVVLSGDLNISPRPIDGFPKIRTNPEQHVRNRADYNSKFLDANNMDGLRAADSFRYLHPESRKYTWISTTRPWLSSCDRVDHILVSRSITEGTREAFSHPCHSTDDQLPQHDDLNSDKPEVSLLEADILMTEADRATSDHVPIYVTLAMKKSGV